MCGIVGVHDYGGAGYRVDPGRFDAMVDALAHRGPDGRGVWHGDGVALGHRRLSILDPTPAGAQPMAYRNGDVVITYNGEIYNFRRLREDLTRAGHAFRTSCDTEVLLAAYSEWGLGAVGRLNGIFAFALWDAPRRRLWLARDRLGVKPLFYSAASGVLRFASEVKALLADPEVVRRPCALGIDAFLSFGFVPAPWTGFEGILQLPPAHEAVIEAGRIRVAPYWALSMLESPRPPGRALEEFADRFGAAVDGQMVSDVPIGGFLSGGIDSAAVVTRMAATAGRRVRTFSVGFAEETFDESGLAAETARLIGTEHTQSRLEMDLAETVPRMVEHCEEPLADSSWLAVYHLCEVASEHVKVALSGDGADELLAGYPTYRASRLARGYRLLPRWARHAARSTMLSLAASDRRYNWQQFGTRFVLGAEEGEGRDFASWRIHFRRADKDRICRPDFFDGAEDPVEWYARHYREAPGAATRLKRMLYADLMFYLPNDMLAKVDRAGMAHGLEVRVPFLDHELVEFCATLPDRLLIDWRAPRRNKLILRDYLGATPARPVARRRKTGFNVPIERAMRGELLPLLVDAVGSSKFRQTGPFEVDRLLDLARRHSQRRIDAGHALFSALVLALWWERWL